MDCGPTPNATIYVNQSIAANSYDWAAFTATYQDLRTAVYNTYNASNNTVYFLENHSTTYAENGATEFVRNHLNVNCRGYNYTDPLGGSSIYGFFINAVKDINIFNCTISNFDRAIDIRGDAEVSITNNSFEAAGEPYGIILTNGDYCNITNNTFTGDYAQQAISLSSSDTNNNIWQNSFYGRDGISVGSSDTTSLCINNVGNYYNVSVTVAQVNETDCGPTPNSAVYVNQSIPGSSFTFSTSTTANPNYKYLQEAYYNVHGNQTIVLLQNFNSTSNIGTIRDDVILDCKGNMINTSVKAISVNGERNNTIKSCLIRTSGTSSYGVEYVLSANENLIFNTTINTSGTSAYGVYFSSSHNNSVVNTTLNIPSANDTISTSASENILINSTFDRGNLSVSGSGSSIYIKWYLLVNVTDQNGVPLANVSVNITNSTNSLLITNVTDDFGLIEQYTIIEFIQNNLTAILQTPQNITGNKTGYTTNSTLVNLTTTNSTTVRLILSSGNSGPELTAINITPVPAYTNDTVTVNTTYTDADNNAGAIYFQWYLNGTNIFNQTNLSIANGTNVFSSLNGNNFSRSDRINLSVYADDGTANSTLLWSNNITIQNTNPVVTAMAIIPTTAYTNDTLSINTTFSDLDTDGGTIYIQWYLNGTNIFNQTNGSIENSTIVFGNLSSNNFSAGDRINASVYADDGISNSSMQWSNLIMIQNTAPIITAPGITPAIAYTNDTLTTNITYTDLDLHSGTVFLQWYVNNTNVFNQTNASISNGTVIVGSLNRFNFSRDDLVNVSVYADDGTVNSTLRWSNTVTILQANTAPSITTPVITPNIAYKNDTLQGNVTYTDNESNTGTIFFRWYVNNSNVFNQTNNSINNNTIIVSSLNNANFSRGSTINLSVYADDGTTNSTLLWSNNITIQNTVPALTAISITPTTVYTNDTLSINTTYSDLDIDGGTIYIQWYLNGTNIFNQTNGSIANSTIVFGNLSGNNFSAGDRINASVYADDGIGNSSTQWSNQITIQNTAPITTNPVITPAIAYTNDTLSINTTYMDSDGNGGTIYVQWYRNNTNIFNQTNTSIANATLIIASLTSNNFSRTDQVNASVYAFDGGLNSSIAWSNTINISNTPPQFNQSLTAQAVTVGNSLSYQISCSDIDNDSMSYSDNTSLFDINQSTGLISDTPSNEEAGIYTVGINCSDGLNITAQTFLYTITAVQSTPSGGSGPGSGGGVGQKKEECSTYKECKSNEYCNENGKCVIAECHKNSDCPKEKYCVNYQCLKIFDLKTIYVDSPISPGDDIDFTYLVKGMANISGDVTLTFTLTKEGEFITSGADVIFVGDFEEKVESTNIYLPLTVEEGIYTFTIHLQFENYEINSHRTLEVKKDSPLVSTLSILNFPTVFAGDKWTLKSLLAVNKDEELKAVVTRNILHEGRLVWTKESVMLVNRSVIINDSVITLDAGQYTIEIKSVINNKTTTATETVTIVENKDGQEKESSALAGQAFQFSKDGNIQNYVLVILGIMAAISVILILLAAKKRQKVISTYKATPVKESIVNSEEKEQDESKEENHDIHNLEKWVEKMKLARLSNSTIESKALTAGWTEEQINSVIMNMEAVKKLKEQYGFWLTQDKINELQLFIQREFEKGKSEPQIMKDLTKAGWDKEVIAICILCYRKKISIKL